MFYVNQKIVQIISKEFGISKTDIGINTDLISEFNLCGWELEWLYAKIEKAFKIEINSPIPQQDLSIRKLVSDVGSTRTGFNKKRKAC